MVSLQNLFTRKKCVFCQSRKGFMKTYVNDQGKPVRVCEKCLEYAERRAMKKA